MNPTLRLLLLAAALAGCRGTPNDPQPAPVPVQATTAPATNAPAAGPAAAPPAAAQGPVGIAATPMEVRKLGNGVHVALATQADDDVWMFLQLAAGADHGAPGLAELAAATLVTTGDANRGRAGLQAAIEALGGTLWVDVGPRSTSVTARVPAGRWLEAQQAFADAVAAPTVSRSQLERVREDLVMRRIDALWRERDREAARAFVLGETGTADYLADLLDRDVGETVLFLLRACRPELTTFAVRGPVGADAAAKALGDSFGTWLAPPSGGRPVPPPAQRRLQPGVYWAPSPPAAVCTASVLLPLPGLLAADAAEMFVLHACVTQDGVGGRLGELLRERGLGHVRWRSRFVQYDETAGLALTTDTSPAEALRLWQCVEDARRSLRERPPTTAELDIARRRAALTARLGASDGAAVLRQRVALAVAGDKARDPVDRISELGRAGAMDATAAIAAYLRQSAALVVFGGEVPAGTPGVHTFELLPAGAYARLVAPDPRAQVAAAAPLLDDAMSAVGGTALLRRFQGADAVSDIQGPRNPPAVERLHWARPAEVARTRELLGGKVETRVANGKGSESLGKDRIDLDASEQARLLREMERHPVALLAAHARGELDFRPVSKRNVGDRDLMVLEAVTGHFDRLRIHIDAGSKLVRIVEVWETTTDGAVVHVQDAWSDYRGTGGLRAPFRRITELDDGENRVETVHRTWVPVFAAR